MRHICRLIPLLIACGAVQISKAETLGQWQQALSKKSLREIASATESTVLSTWPIVTAESNIPDLASQDQAFAREALALEFQMLAKIQADFLAGDKDSLESAKTYTKLSRLLRSAGGYPNVLLSDLLTRLATIRTFGYVSLDSTPVVDARHAVESLDVPIVNPASVLNTFSKEDKELRVTPELLSEIKPNDNLFRIISMLRPKQSLFESPKNTGELLRKPSNIELLARLASSELMYRIDLKGFIEFKSLGGSRSELTPEDIRPFFQRMAGTEARFRYPLLNVKKLSVSNLLSLYDLRDASPKRQGFLDLNLR